MSDLVAHVREQQVAGQAGSSAVNFFVTVILDPSGYHCWAAAITSGATTGSWYLPQAGTYHTVISGLGGTSRTVTITPGTGSAVCAVDAAGVVEITLVASAAALVVVS